MSVFSFRVSSVFRQITFLFICSLFCRGGDRLPGVGFWRREEAQASGFAGGGATGDRKTLPPGNDGSDREREKRRLIFGVSDEVVVPRPLKVVRVS